MARRSAGNSGVSSYGGRFHRTVGRFLNERGEVRPKKFLLGTDRRSAERANARLERLWDEVVVEHEASVRWMGDIGGNLVDSDMVSGDADARRPRRLDVGPLWRAESLLIAEVVRRGEHQVVVPVGQDADHPTAYVERFAYLRRTYGTITFVPASTELYAAGQHALGGEARNLVRQAQDLSELAQVPLPAATGQTLYQALDAYAAFAVQRNAGESGLIEGQCARRLKDAHPDVPLEQFGISAMGKLAAYWAARPVSRATGRPVALDTIANHLKVARRFVHWLHRTDAFKWSKPVDAEQALRVRVKRLRSDAEVAALGKGVAVWTVDELATLYRYATDRERLLILLGLNCAFAQAEFCTLRRDEVVRDNATAAVKRVRRKSHVYGEFPLWPQTVVGLDWFAAWGGAAAVEADDRDYLMLRGTAAGTTASGWPTSGTGCWTGSRPITRPSGACRSSTCERPAGNWSAAGATVRSPACSSATDGPSRATTSPTPTRTGPSTRSPPLWRSSTMTCGRCSTPCRTPSLGSRAVRPRSRGGRSSRSRGCTPRDCRRLRSRAGRD